MSVFITGDLHAASYFDKLQRFADVFGPRLPQEAYLIVLGDFSLPWTRSDKEMTLLQKLERFPFTTLFIDGNHENFDALETLPEARWHGGRVHVVSESVLHLCRGEVFNIGRHRMLALGGAHSRDAERLRELGTWYAREVPNESERTRTLARLESDADIDTILTHQPPTSALKELADAKEVTLVPDEYNHWLEQNVRRPYPTIRWFYGHMHEDRPWETLTIPLMHVIYDLDSVFPNVLWGPDSLIDDWYPSEPW